jgi:hypothetical protein
LEIGANVGLLPSTREFPEVRQDIVVNDCQIDRLIPCSGKKPKLRLQKSAQVLRKNWLLLHENTPDFCRTFPWTQRPSMPQAQQHDSKLDTVDTQDTTHQPTLPRT